MKVTSLLKTIIFISPLLISCGGKKNENNNSNNNEKDPEPLVQEKEELSVVVLAGQSNMEGNTWSMYVSTEYGFSEEEVTRIKAGYEGITMSYRCFWNGAPSQGTDSYGLFMPVKLGQANTTSKFGPEIGIADYLTEQGLSGKVALIKYAVGASALDPQANEWGGPSSGRETNGKWYERMLALVSDGLDSLAQYTEMKPVIKAFCWMQGEADAGNASYRSRYLDNTTNFVNDLRSEWEDHSKKDGFTFIDAYISQYWTGYTAINQAKADYHDSDDNSAVINTIDEGLEYDKQPVGGVDYYHYDASSMFKLGRLFGEQIKKAL